MNSIIERLPKSLILNYSDKRYFSEDYEDLEWNQDIFIDWGTPTVGPNAFKQGWYIYYGDADLIAQYGKTLEEAAEKMHEFLSSNNLLTGMHQN